MTVEAPARATQHITELKQIPRGSAAALLPGAVQDKNKLLLCWLFNPTGPAESEKARLMLSWDSFQILCVILSSIYSVL